MSDSAVLEKKAPVDASAGKNTAAAVSAKAAVTIAVMDQNPQTEIRAESPLYHAELGKLAELGKKTGGVVFRELALLGHLTIRGSQQNSSFMNGCAEVFGIALPTKPLTTASQGAISIRWVSPDEWLVILPMEHTFDVEKALRGLIEGHFQIVNVSGGQTIFELSGPDAINVLKKSAPLDFHQSEFPVGKAVNTKFAKSTAQIYRKSTDIWELVVRRSFSDYLWLWIQDASMEYGLVVKR
jgi:Sarcosine oxidase gamma subunit